MQRHSLLSRRLLIDDPDDLESRAILSRRVHGTAMASLILHGDLNADERSLERPLYVRPIMFAPADGRERTDGDRLLIDTIYRAVLRMKGGGEDAAAPSVFLINLSMGDTRRPFSRLIEPVRAAARFPVRTLWRPLPGERRQRDGTAAAGAVRHLGRLRERRRGGARARHA